MKKLLILAAPLILGGCFKQLIPPPEQKPVSVIARNIPGEPDFSLAYDIDSGRSFFAWAPAPGKQAARAMIAAADKTGRTEVLGGAGDAPPAGVIQSEPGLAMSSSSVYVRWVENSSGTLRLKVAGYDLSGRRTLKETVVSDLSLLVKRHGVIAPSDRDSAFIAWEDFNLPVNAPFVGIAEAGQEGIRWRHVLGNRTENERYFYPAIAADGEGGVFAAFRHVHDGDQGIVVRHFNPGGATWDDDVQAANVMGYKSGPKIAADLHGSLFVIWEDGRSGTLGIYGQKISSAGAVLWDRGGVSMAVSEGNHWNPEITADGEGGFFCAWIEETKGARWQLKMQRIGRDGAPAWGPGGVAVSPSDSRQSAPALIQDDEGGIIIAWNEPRYGYLDVFAQRLSPEGVNLWKDEGVRVTRGDEDQVAPEMVPDGDGGCVIAWERRAGKNNWELAAVRLNPMGFQCGEFTCPIAE